MDLTPNADQEAFRIATIDWLADHMPLDKARDRPASLWVGMAEMGWLGMTAPDMGLDHATEAVVFCELGRYLAPVGVIASAVAARWAGTSGKVALAVPTGDRLRLFDAAAATLALGVWDGRAGTVAIPAGLTGAPGIDQTAPQDVLAPAPAPDPIADPRAALHLQLLAAAYALGAADLARDLAADYAKVREQFDRPIGWFQGVKHPCADMAVRCAVARSQLYYAACALDEGSADAGFHIAAAKRLADTAALDNGRMAIQIHGGIGITDEAYPHLPLKRAHLLQFVAPVRTADLLEPELEDAA